MLMNKLPSEKRAQALQMMAEGLSLRTIVRLTGISRTTLHKLLEDAGQAFSDYQDRTLVNLKCKRLQIDEAWSFFTGDAIAASFITKGFRTGRRHKASFVTITQGVDDYYEFNEARAAWENSSLKLIFLQEEAALIEHQKQHETFTDYSLFVSLLSRTAVGVQEIRSDAQH